MACCSLEPSSFSSLPGAEPLVLKKVNGTVGAHLLQGQTRAQFVSAWSKKSITHPKGVVLVLNQYTESMSGSQAHGVIIQMFND